MAAGLCNVRPLRAAQNGVKEIAHQLASQIRPDAPYAELPSGHCLHTQAPSCSFSIGSTGDTVDGVSWHIGKS